MDRIISVCPSCLRCSCLRGVSPCPKSVVSGTIDIGVSVADLIDRENPEYYSVDSCLEHDGMIRFSDGTFISRENWLDGRQET